MSTELPTADHQAESKPAESASRQCPYSSMQLPKLELPEEPPAAEPGAPVKYPPGKYPPGPRNGLIGLANIRRLRTDLLDGPIALRKQYGDCVSYRVGPVRIYHFTHPDQISHVMVKQAGKLIKNRSVRWRFKRWMGSGLLLNEGQPWHQQRRKVRWSMQQMAPQAHAPMIVRQARDLIDRQAGREFDLAGCMDRLAFYLNVNTLLGEEAAAAQEPLYDAANTVHEMGIDELSNFRILPDWLPIPSKARFRAALKLFDDVLLKAAAERRVAGSPVGDLLSWMVVGEDRKEGTRGMTNRQARDEVVNLLMGGKETVGASLTWSSYLLACHPEIQEKAAAEVREVLAGREPTLDDFPRLAYTQMVLKEVMRLYPPVYSLTREVIEPFDAAGYHIAKGSQIVIPVYAVHRDERWFDNPNEFRPERFLPELESAQKRYSYFPFGAGPRACVGKQLGYDQCVLVLTWLLANYKIALAPGQGPPPLATDIVLHPREALRMVLTPRQG